MNTAPKIPLIDINSETFVEEFMNAIRANLDDTFTIMMPQFDRTDGKIIEGGGDVDWNNLKNLSHEVLTKMGLGVWSKTDKGTHYLFPKEWYSSIPDGLEILVISNETEIFEAGVTDDDTRFGMLAYGFFKPV